LYAELVRARSAQRPDNRKARDLQRRIDRYETKAAHLDREAYAEVLERNGAIGLNAATTWDVTQYFAQFPRLVLPLWLRLEADRLRYPLFHNFQSERTAAEREARQAPNLDGWRPFFREVFGGWDALHTPFGVPEEMERIDRPAAADFMRRMYRAERIVVTLVGDLLLEDARQLCEQVFADWQVGPGVNEPFSEGKSVPALVTRTGAQSSQVLIGVPRRSISAADSAALEALAELINSESLSPLSKRSPSRSSAWSAAAWPALPGLRGPSMFALMLDGPPGVPADQLHDVALDSLRALSTTPDEDLRGAILLTRVKLAERLDNPASLAATLGQYQVVYDDWLRAFDELDAASALTPQALRAVCARLLLRSPFV
jgi:predicted Zn-dependent peptidase